MHIGDTYLQCEMHCIAYKTYRIGGWTFLFLVIMVFISTVLIELRRSNPCLYFYVLNSKTDRRIQSKARYIMKMSFYDFTINDIKTASLQNT